MNNEYDETSMSPCGTPGSPSCKKDENHALAIGLGVGLGLGIPLLLFVFYIMQKSGRGYRTKTSTRR